MLNLSKNKYLLYIEIALLIVVFFIIGKFVWWMLKVAIIALLGFVAYLIYQGIRDVKKREKEEKQREQTTHTSEKSSEDEPEYYDKNE